MIYNLYITLYNTIIHHTWLIQRKLSSRDLQSVHNIVLYNHSSYMAYTKKVIQSWYTSVLHTVHCNIPHDYKYRENYPVMVLNLYTYLTFFTVTLSMVNTVSVVSNFVYIIVHCITTYCLNTRLQWRQHNIVDGNITHGRLKTQWKLWIGDS